MTCPALTGPLSLRLSITDRCQHRCLYCTPPEGVRPFRREAILRYEEIAAFVRVLQRRVGLAKVHLTGGEPLVRRGLADLVRMIAAEGVADLAMTTNGALLAEAAGELKRAGLHRVNVSLDSIDPAIYGRVTRGGDMRQAIAGINAAVEAGLRPVKLNATLLRGINDAGAADLVRFAIRRGLTLRFIELMPIGAAEGRYREWFIPAAELLRRLRREFRIRPLGRRPGSSSRQYGVTDLSGTGGGSGTIGMIASASRPFCADCRRLRLTATGELIGCLAVGRGGGILALLRAPGGVDEEALLRAVALALAGKRSGGPFTTGRIMVKVGG